MNFSKDINFRDVSKKLKEISNNTGLDRLVLMEEFIRTEEELFDKHYKTTGRFSLLNEFSVEALNQIENKYKKNISTYKNE